MLVARLREPGGRPDFRFGLCEIGAFSSLLCWFWDLQVRGGGGQKTLAFGAPGVGAQKTKAFFGCPASAQ